MLLKGEGASANTTEAVEWYEKAAAQTIRELNGLGYLYFFGQSLPQNATRGCSEYFPVPLIRATRETL